MPKEPGPTFHEDFYDGFSEYCQEIFHKGLFALIDYELDRFIVPLTKRGYSFPRAIAALAGSGLLLAEGIHDGMEKEKFAVPMSHAFEGARQVEALLTIFFMAHDGKINEIAANSESVYTTTLPTAESADRYILHAQRAANLTKRFPDPSGFTFLNNIPAMFEEYNIGTDKEGYKDGVKNQIFNFKDLYLRTYSTYDGPKPTEF